MARLVPGHEREDLGHHGVGFLQRNGTSVNAHQVLAETPTPGCRSKEATDLEPAPELLVEEEPGELRGAGALEELDEYLAERSVHLVRGGLELRVAHEVGLVVVRLELLQQRVELRLVELLVDLGVEEAFHLVEVGGVEPRREQRLLDLRLAPLLGARGLGRRGGRGGGRHAEADHGATGQGQAGGGPGGAVVHCSGVEEGELHGGGGHWLAATGRWLGERLRSGSELS
jgi:hypothetical protein